MYFCWVDMFEFATGILSGESPVDDGDSPVTLMFKWRNLSLAHRLIGYSTIETLVAEDTQLYLNHVQPDAVFWSEVKFHSFDYTTRFGRLERIVQGARPVGNVG